MRASAHAAAEPNTPAPCAALTPRYAAQYHAVALGPPQGFCACHMQRQQHSTALQLHPTFAALCNYDECIPPQVRSQCIEHRASASTWARCPVSCNVQDAKLMEWAAKKKKAVQACPQCYRLIEKGGGCKCACVMTCLLQCVVQLPPHIRSPSAVHTHLYVHAV